MMTLSSKPLQFLITTTLYTHTLAVSNSDKSEDCNFLCSFFFVINKRTNLMQQLFDDVWTDEKPAGIYFILPNIKY